MGLTDLISKYRRFLKRRNCSAHTVKNYMNILDHFSDWLQIPIEEVTIKETDAYMDHLLRHRKKPKTINCHFSCIHAFYEYLIEDETNVSYQSGKKELQTSSTQTTAQTSQGRAGRNTLQRN